MAQAAEPLGGFSFLPPRLFNLTYHGSLVPQDNPSQLQQHQLAMQVPLYKGEVDNLWLSSRAGLLQLDRELILPSLVAIPKQWWNIEFGGQYIHTLPGHKMLGARFSTGSASDTPFSEADATTLTGSLFYNFPHGEKGAWLLMLYYSNNSSFLEGIPVPGFAYSYRTTGFFGLFGFPFATVRWQFLPQWSLAASVIGPTATKTEIAYTIFPGSSVFIAYDWGQTLILQANRATADERLAYDEMRTFTGVRFPIMQKLSSEWLGGYAFHREIFAAESYFDDHRNAVALEDSFFAAWNLKLEL